MTISSTTRIAGPFVGTGSASVFPFTFKVFAASDLDVIRLNSSTGVETTLVLTTDYTVTLNGNQNTNPGGSVTLVAGALASGFTLTITSDISNLQPTDLTNQGGFYPEVITDSLDRATIQIQQMSEDVGRSLKGPISDGNLNMELPTAAVRASKYLVFDANGLPIPSAGSGTDSALRTDLANTGVTTAGAGLVGFRTADATSVGRTVLSKLRDVVSVKDFGAVGDGVADDTVAVQACVDAAKNGTNKNIYIPAGTYLVSHIDMIGLVYSNLTFIGEGMPTFKFKLPAGGRQIIAGYPNPTFARSNLADGIFVLDANSANQFTNDANSIKNVTFIGIKFQMNVAVDGFDELMHCVCASGTSGLYFDHCQFIGFMGDGIAVCRGRGTGPVVGSRPSYGYNANTVVTNCIFDGVNKDNRQAISIYYCDGFTITDNVFKNTTRSNMPGAIDIEPDNSLTNTRCGLIERNSFSNIGGSSAILFTFKQPLVPSSATQPTRQFRIALNTFDNIDRHVFTAGSSLVRADTLYNAQLTFEQNNCRDIGDVFYLLAVSGIRIAGNTFDTTTLSATGTSDDSNIFRCQDIVVENNDFISVRPNVGAASTSGIVVSQAGADSIPLPAVDFINNRFIDAGKYAIHSVVRGAVGKIIGNRFFSSVDANPWCLFASAGTVAQWEYLKFDGNIVEGTFASGSNGTSSVNKLLWISGGALPTTYNAKTPETFDYGTTIFESTGVWPEASPPASTNGMLVTTRLKDATSISVAQYFYPAVNDTARPVYYRHAASNTTWQNWRKFSQTVI